jgi:Ulp1 family protease
MAMVDVPGKCMVYWDSLGWRPRALGALLRRWVSAEGAGSGVPSGRWHDASAWPLHTPGDAPRQDNNSDCGVFAILSAARAAAGQRLDFGPADIPAARRALCHALCAQRLDDI